MKIILLISVCYFGIACSSTLESSNESSDNGINKEISDRVIDESADVEYKNELSKSMNPVEMEDSLVGIKREAREKLSAKVLWFKEQGEGFQTDLNLIPSDFKEYYLFFIGMDSTMQYRSLIDHNNVGMIDDCDTMVILKKSNWLYSNWNFLDHFSDNNSPSELDGWDNKFYFSENTFFYEFRLNEVGVIYQTGFELVDEEWKLTLYYVNNC